jgi:hypothetical protein
MKQSLEEPTADKTVKNFPEFYGTRRFIAEFTKALPEPDDSNSHSTYMITYILILSSHLRAYSFL